MSQTIRHRLSSSVSIYGLAQRGLSLGLHLVDFEQLKVENAHLSDKIEDRGRQLADAQKQSHAALNVGPVVTIKTLLLSMS